MAQKGPQDCLPAVGPFIALQTLQLTPQNTYARAPTRSGKGVGLVVPTLLTWPGSAIVHDIKGENWDVSFNPLTFVAIRMPLG